MSLAEKIPGRVFLLVQKGNKTTWSLHFDQPEAEREGSIYKAQGYEIKAILTGDEHLGYPAFGLDGSCDEDSKTQFAEVYRPLSKDEDEVCGYMAGHEITLSNLRSFQKWVAGAIDYVEKGIPA
jgi:hypothetical protein